MRAPTTRQIARAAWLEYKVTKAASGFATEIMLAASEPPPEFVAVELGFGVGEGPSLIDTMYGAQQADTTNGRRHRAYQQRREPPRREHATDRQARLQSMLAAARAA